MTSDYDRYVEDATKAASQGKWDVAFENLSHAHKLKPDDPGVLTGIAKCAMNLELMKDALTFFQQVIILAPDSPIAHVNLGNIQEILGLFDDAEGSYQNAITFDPDFAIAWKHLGMLYIRNGNRTKEGIDILRAVGIADQEDAEVRSLLGDCFFDIGEYDNALYYYKEALKLEPNHPFALEKYNELKKKGITESIPEDNSLSFDRIAKPEHAKKLASLKDLIKKPEAPAATGGSRPMRSLAFYGPAELASEARLSPPARAFAKTGREVKLSTKFNPADLERGDFFFFANPHYAKELMDGARQVLHAASQRSGVRIVIDLDRDFYTLPIDMPEFAHVGPGNPPLLKELEEILKLADVVTIPTHTLNAVYGKEARRIVTLPPSWSQADTLWEKSAPKRKTVNVGVVCTHTRAADVTIVKKALGKILDESPDVMLTVGGEMDLYNAFDNVPEARRTFIPIGQARDYPFLLANFDLLLVPFEDIPYNQHASDIALMEAGIRRIPWIASRVSAFTEWKEGGILAENEAEWEDALRRLVKDADLRKELGSAGRAKADTREADACLGFWDDILKD